jgi:hypothetical protein
MVDVMIATAFLTNDMEKVLDAGSAAVDARSVMSQIIADVRRWYKENPRDWRLTRKLTKDKYCKYGGHDMRDRNGVWLNGASTVSALLYGDGDMLQTIRAAFNFGWDADNNAAASGCILGVMKGNKWMSSQGWDIQDRFRNTSRDNMPEDETITKYEDRLIDLARRNIRQRGGSIVKGTYRIPVEQPANVEPLLDLNRQHTAMQTELKPEIERGILKESSSQAKARAAYLAICLDLAPDLKSAHAKEWSSAVDALAGYPRVLQAIFYEAPFPAGDRIREKAVLAGLQKPATRIRLWS